MAALTIVQSVRWLAAMTVTPCSARYWHVARPMPPVDPATMAVKFGTELIIVMPFQDDYNRSIRKQIMYDLDPHIRRHA
jgi:hypothetical protein